MEFWSRLIHGEDLRLSQSGEYLSEYCMFCDWFSKRRGSWFKGVRDFTGMSFLMVGEFRAGVGFLMISL
jgi:hypothetical protein